MLSEAMERFIKEHEKEAYDLLLTIAKIPSPSNHEEKRAQFCCNWLKEQGAEGVYIDEALNVVYPAALRDNVDVYMAHTDVVFPDETELPLKVENGRICCPGVGDDTACLVCVLLAAKYTALMIKEGKLNQIRPETEPGLIFVCNSGEEGLGNLKGVKKICEDYGSRMSTFCTFDGSQSIKQNIQSSGEQFPGDFFAFRCRFVQIPDQEVYEKMTKIVLYVMKMS